MPINLNSIKNILTELELNFEEKMTFSNIILSFLPNFFIGVLLAFSNYL